MLNIEFCCSYSGVWLEIHANIQVSKHPALHPEDGISPEPQAALVVLPPCLFKQRNNTQTQQPQQVKQTCTTNKHKHNICPLGLFGVGTSRPSHFLKSICFLRVLGFSRNSLGLGLRGWFLVKSAKLLPLIPNMMVSGPRHKCLKLSFAVRTLEFGLRSMQTYKFPSIPLTLNPPGRLGCLATVSVQTRKQLTNTATTTSKPNIHKKQNETQHMSPWTVCTRSDCRSCVV
jgi:hypothetical protein